MPSYWGLTEFPEDAQLLSDSVETLNLANPFSDLPDWLRTFRHLTTLDMNYSKMSTIPDVVYKLTSLTSLKCTGNAMDSVSPRIGQLTLLSHVTQPWYTSFQLTNCGPFVTARAGIQQISGPSAHIGFSYQPAISRIVHQQYHHTPDTNLGMFEYQYPRSQVKIPYHLPCLLTIKYSRNKLTFIPAELLPIVQSFCSHLWGNPWLQLSQHEEQTSIREGVQRLVDICCAAAVREHPSLLQANTAKGRKRKQKKPQSGWRTAH